VMLRDRDAAARHAPATPSLLSGRPGEKASCAELAGRETGHLRSVRPGVHAVGFTDAAQLERWLGVAANAESLAVGPHSCRH
jgi:hypothetical protein